MTRHIAKVRLFIDVPIIVNEQLVLTDAQRHYLINVLRLGMGANLTIFNGRDGEWSGRLSEINKNCKVEVKEKLKPQTNSLDLWLLFVPVKKARLDFIAQKASELGVSRIWPVRTDYCQIKRVNNFRLIANAIEAAEQTERMDIAEIRAFDDFSLVIDKIENDRLVIWCDEKSAGSPEYNISDVLEQAPSHQKAAILIGPEGGFSPLERKRLGTMKNCLKISLGSRILRADTAAIAAISCYQSICGDWN